MRSVPALKSIDSCIQLTQGEIQLILDALYVLNPDSVKMRDAQEALIGRFRELSEQYRTREPGIATILNLVAECYHVTIAELVGHRKTMHIATARHVAFYLCRTMTKRSYSGIARFFNRDHSTVIHSVNIVAKRMKQGDTSFRHTIEELQQAILRVSQ